jgi:hypothetical protein
MKTSFPTFLTGYAPGAADGWADLPKSSSVTVNVEQTGVTFGSVAWPDQGKTGTRHRLKEAMLKDYATTEAAREVPL